MKTRRFSLIFSWPTKSSSRRGRRLRSSSPSACCAAGSVHRCSSTGTPFGRGQRSAATDCAGRRGPRLRDPRSTAGSSRRARPQGLLGLTGGRPMAPSTASASASPGGTFTGRDRPVARARHSLGHPLPQFDDQPGGALLADARQAGQGSSRPRCAGSAAMSAAAAPRQHAQGHLRPDPRHRDQQAEHGPFLLQRRNRRATSCPRARPGGSTAAPRSPGAGSCSADCADSWTSRPMPPPTATTASVPPLTRMPSRNAIMATLPRPACGPPRHYPQDDRRRPELIAPGGVSGRPGGRRGRRGSGPPPGHRSGPGAALPAVPAGASP